MHDVERAHRGRIVACGSAAELLDDARRLEQAYLGDAVAAN